MGHITSNGYNVQLTMFLIITIKILDSQVGDKILHITIIL